MQSGAGDITDEQILTYEQAIKDEEANKLPLVNFAEPLSALLKEYETGSDAYKSKIQNLAKTHRHFRRCRGDGNCFYRAFAFAWFERLLQSGTESDVKKSLSQLDATCELLESVGFQKLAYEDFVMVAKEVLDSVVLPDVVSKSTETKATADGPTADGHSLVQSFQADETSNAIVVHFRFVTSAYLKRHQEEYIPFLDFIGSMEQYCAHNVEAMGREVEQIHIIALAKAFGVPVRICYLSGSTLADEANFHEFSPESPPSAGPFTTPLSFLYRPGHYDLLY